MRITITARHGAIPDELRTRARAVLQRLRRQLDKATPAPRRAHARARR